MAPIDRSPPRSPAGSPSHKPRLPNAISSPDRGSLTPSAAGGRGQSAPPGPLRGSSSPSVALRGSALSARGFAVNRGSAASISPSSRLDRRSVEERSPGGRRSTEEGTPGVFQDFRRGVALRKLSIKDLGENAGWMLMGQANRHAINGRIQTAAPTVFEDYSIVDLYKRRRLSDSMQTLRQDKYLFRPYPLAHRTWLYHEDFRRQLTLDKDENAMIKSALSQQCIDAPITAGRWSPVATLAPLAVGVALTYNMALLLASLVAVLGMQVASEWANDLRWYKLLRPFTLVPRLGLYAGILVSFFAGDGAVNGLAYLGYIVSLAMIIVDLCSGDLQTLITINLLCCWEILHVLPKRLYVCRRIGATSFEDKFGQRGVICEEIVGFSPWSRDLALIVDMQGVLVELRPLTPQDWDNIYAQNVEQEEEVVVLGLDVFNDATPTLSDVEREQLKVLRSRSDFIT